MSYKYLIPLAFVIVISIDLFALKNKKETELKIQQAIEQTYKDGYWDGKKAGFKAGLKTCDDLLQAMDDGGHY